MDHPAKRRRLLEQHAQSMESEPHPYSSFLDEGKITSPDSTSPQLDLKRSLFPRQFHQQRPRSDLRNMRPGLRQRPAPVARQASFIPGVNPSSIPGVIPSSIPGVIPSSIPGIVPTSVAPAALIQSLAASIPAGVTGLPVAASIPAGLTAVPLPASIPAGLTAPVVPAAAASTSDSGFVSADAVPVQSTSLPSSSSTSPTSSSSTSSISSSTSTTPSQSSVTRINASASHKTNGLAGIRPTRSGKKPNATRTGTNLSRSSTGSAMPASTGTFSGNQVHDGAGSYSTPTSSGTSSITAAADSSHHTSSAVPTPVIAGSVVGGVAGLTFILLLALILLRWWRRNDQHRELEDSPPPAPPPQMSYDPPSSRSLLPIGAATYATGLGRPRSFNDGTPQSGSFERLSGRKLASPWSPGMASPARNPDSPTLSASSAARHPSSSIYPSGGTLEREAEELLNPFDDPFSDPSEANGAKAAADGIVVSPGLGRTPTIHTPSQGHASFLAAPGVELRGSRTTLGSIGRGRTSMEGSRASKFSEEM